MGTFLALIFCVVIAFPLLLLGTLILGVGIVGVSCAAWSWRVAQEDNEVRDEANVCFAIFLPVAACGVAILVIGLALCGFVLNVIDSSF